MSITKEYIPPPPPAPDSMSLRRELIRRLEAGEISKREFGECQRAIIRLAAGRRQLESLGFKFGDRPPR